MVKRTLLVRSFKVCLKLFWLDGQHTKALVRKCGNLWEPEMFIKVAVGRRWPWFVPGCGESEVEMARARNDGEEAAAWWMAGGVGWSTIWRWSSYLFWTLVVNMFDVFWGVDATSCPTCSVFIPIFWKAWWFGMLGSMMIFFSGAGLYPRPSGLGPRWTSGVQFHLKFVSPAPGSP